MKKPNILWTPFAKQARALSCPAFELGYGGAPGGGKSDFTLVDPMRYLAEKGFKALLLRRRMVDLERSLIVRSQELYRGRGVYDGQKKRWKFANDCSIEFGHCQRPGDIYNYQSAQYAYIGIEQVEQFTEPMYSFFFSRIRTTNPAIKPKIRCNFNPGGIGHTWLKKRFWIGDEAKKPNLIHTVKESLTRPDGQMEEFEYGRAFIPALVYDNEFIMKNDRQYLMRLMQLPEPTRTAYLEGRFDLFEGQFFKEWNPKVHVIDSFEIPPNWRRSIAFDWGYNDPTVVLWFAEDPGTGIIYCYRELFINQTIDIEVAKLFADMSKDENIFCIYYPWDLDNTNPQTGVSMHERMDAVTGNKFWWKEGNKQRLNGWSATRNLLALRPDGKPRLQIFRNCTNLIRTMPEQVFDDTNSEDLDTLGDDHCVDALRYFAATFRANGIEDDVREQQKVFDLGGAIKKDNKFFFKKEEPRMAFSWINE